MIDSAMRATACAAVLALLGACSAGEPTRPADIVLPAQGSTDFGDLRVHYNAVPTLSLTEPMARSYGVERDAGSALVFVALRRVAAGEEQPLEGDAVGRVFDLQGRRQPVVFREVEVGEYTDHIATVAISARDSYRFEVGVKADGRNHVVKFQRNF